MSSLRDLQDFNGSRKCTTGRLGNRALRSEHSSRSTWSRRVDGQGGAAGVDRGSPRKKSVHHQGKKSTALPTPPSESQSNDPELETESLVVDVEDSELMRPPSLDVDPQGWSSSPYQYVRTWCAPAHNVVEE